MNPWNLVTKYRIQRCCHRCRRWRIRDVNIEKWDFQTYSAWKFALDAVIRRQTKQLYSAVTYGS